MKRLLCYFNTVVASLFSTCLRVSSFGCQSFMPSPLQYYNEKWKCQLLSCIWLWSRGLYPARLLCPWDSPGKNAGVGCHALLQGIFPTQGENLGLLHCGQIFFTSWATREVLQYLKIINCFIFKSIKMTSLFVREKKPHCNQSTFWRKKCV